jgi:hypothetical protein
MVQNYARETVSLVICGSYTGSCFFILITHASRTTNMHRRKDILIAARNKEIASVVGENYRENTGDDAGAAMYYVSNLMYMRHLRGYDTMDELSVPTMTLDEPQISALCSHIYALPSRGRTSDLDHSVRITAPSLLNIVQMSVSTTILARVNHLTAIIRKAQMVRTIDEVFSNEIADSLRIWILASKNWLPDFATLTSSCSTIS